MRGSLFAFSGTGAEIARQQGFLRMRRTDTCGSRQGALSLRSTGAVLFRLRQTSKDSSSNSGDIVDSLTAVNMAKYIDKSREAGDKQTYDELKTYFTVAAAMDESAKFCKDNTPITATINNDGLTIVDKNGKKLDPDSPFMKSLNSVAGGDVTTFMKCKIKCLNSGVNLGHPAFYK